MREVDKDDVQYMLLANQQLGADVVHTGLNQGKNAATLFLYACHVYCFGAILAAVLF